ncbi:MAG: hypothetical protein QM742_15490 [Aquabacterium sp.]
MKKLSFVFRGKRIEIFKGPSRWMTPLQIEALQARLRAIASARFGEEPRYSYFTDPDCFGNKLVVICSDSATHADHCFCAMSLLGRHDGRPVIHLGSVFSASENNGYLNYLYTFGLLFLAWRYGILRKLHITSLTHAPKIFGIVADGFENVYPGVNPSQKPTQTHLALKDRLIDEYIKKDFKLPEVTCGENFLIPSLRRTHDGILLFPDSAETAPRYRNEAVNRRVLSLVDFQRGDDILQIGELWVPYSLPKKIFNILRNSFAPRGSRLARWLTASGPVPAADHS